MANTIELVTLIARVGMLQLRNQIVTPNLVFNPVQGDICQVGDTVKIRRPYTFQANDMDVVNGVTPQNITDSLVDVKVDQWKEVTVQMNDLEATVQNAVQLKRVVGDMVIPIAEKMETSIVNKLTFNTSRTGSVGGVSNAYLDPDKVVDIRTAQRINKVPLNDQQNLFGLLSSKNEGALLKQEKFTSANWTPDGGQTLKNAMIGTRYGYNYFPTQLTSKPTISDTSGAINNGAGYSAGTKTMAVDGLSAAPPEGALLTIVGDTKVHTADAGCTTTSLKIKDGLDASVADDAAITILDVDQNVFFHRNAMAFVPVPLQSSDGQTPGSIIAVVRDPLSGVAVRAEYFRAGLKKTNYLTLDALWGVAMLEEKLSYKYFTQG